MRLVPSSPLRTFPQLLKRALLLILTVGSLSACRTSDTTAAAEVAPIEHRVDVSAINVEEGDIESALQVSGNLAPRTRVALRAKLSGTLASITVDIGDRINAGQVVAALDRREIDAQVDAAKAAVNVARAGLDAAEAALANAALERSRAQNLYDRGAIPKQRLDAADTGNRAASAQRDLAQATLAQSEAALRRAAELQRDATLVSPIDGVIVERHYDAGSLVGPGDMPVVVVADLRVMSLEAGVSELDAGRLRVGMPARVSAQALPGVTFEGTIAAIAPEIDARNRHFLIDVRMSNPERTILSGMYGTAVIPLERVSGVPTVPRDAVTTRDGTRVALRIADDTIEAVPVTEGLSDGVRTAIVAGLKPGDTVVSDARQDVATGVKVNPIFAR